MEKLRSEAPKSSCKSDTEKGICMPSNMSNRFNKRNASGRFGEKKAKDLGALRVGYRSWDAKRKVDLEKNQEEPSSKRQTRSSKVKIVKKFLALLIFVTSQKF